MLIGLLSAHENATLSAGTDTSGTRYASKGHYRVDPLVLQEPQDKQGICKAFNGLGSIALLTGNMETTDKYAESNMRIATELGFPIGIKGAAELLFKINRRKSNWKLALTYFELYVKMRDSILNADNQKTIVRQQMKDIISGDFYWFYKNDSKILVAAMDCTRHGMPGGFLSMIACMHLNEMIIERGESDPGRILTKLHHKFVNSVYKNDSRMTDGMDMTICVIKSDERVLQIGGAKNPAVIVNGEGAQLVKTDRYSIGSKNYNVYYTMEFPYLQGDSIYLYTDGYVDQLGGESKKSSGRKRFMEVLERNCSASGNEQCKVLNSEYQAWKGTRKQLDDLLIFGIKL